jgi:pyruvate,water dikinase
MTATQPGRLVLAFDQIDRTQRAVAGGKGANLGELSRIEGLRVPPGFCVTTHAFARLLHDIPAIQGRLDQLSRLKPGDREAVSELSAELRRSIETIAIPDDVASEIASALARLGDSIAVAVRSSATAEDLPTASFAGQHDSYLNVRGAPAVLHHVRRCWASLFTERAITYRLRHNLDPHRLGIAVVVQEMVIPSAAGVMFTADPLSFDRTVVVVEACFGLGEALVSGLVNPDVFKVRAGAIIDQSVAAKRLAIRVLPDGGIEPQALAVERQMQPALTDAQVVRLAALGRRVEAHFGCPQDIEWCLEDDDFQIVQSRPITTLFPIPPAGDGAKHVYVSVGHGQMMTDALKPLGLSFWQMTTPAPMAEAGGRLFVDVTKRLAAPSSRTALLDLFGKSDPLLRDALQTLVDRGGFLPSLPDADPVGLPPGAAATAPIEPDPALVRELIQESEASVAACRRDIQDKSGTELFDFILEDIQELRRLLFDRRSHQAFMSAIEATWWINEQLLSWLGEKNAADVLTQSVPHNVTSEMGLALLDVADVIRPYPEVVAFLHGVKDGDFLAALDGLDGGPDVRAALQQFLIRYGMRCAGEIDITRPRWSERPATLLPLLLAHVRHLEPGEASRRFEAGQQAAATRERELLERLRALPDGEQKAAETKQRIDRIRTFIGYREYPKYGMISRYFLYKQALSAEAERLVEAGVLREQEDHFFLRFEELREVVRTQQVDQPLIQQRKGAFRAYQALTPPRVLTSDGEAVAGAYQRDDVPSGALAGLAVSAGTIEGRARVLRDLAEADLEPGDILVTAYTDPSWTPLFTGIAGLVTEVGGLMTHGAVIAREYGLPAVVGVEGATERIRDGQRIRLHGTEGYVVLLSPVTG